MSTSHNRKIYIMVCDCAWNSTEAEIMNVRRTTLVVLYLHSEEIRCNSWEDYFNCVCVLQVCVLLLWCPGDLLVTNYLIIILYDMMIQPIHHSCYFVCIFTSQDSWLMWNKTNSHKAQRLYNNYQVTEAPVFTERDGRKELSLQGT